MRKRPTGHQAGESGRNHVMANIVQFENVGLRYGTGSGTGPETLSDISFTLRSGAFYFLTGASGAGKTSLLKLLYLAQRPTRGIIRLFGEDAVVLSRDRLPGFRRRIGVVFQDFRLVPHLSTWDNIALPLRVAGMPEADIEQPVREMLAWVGLADRADARPATLSGGEQQRVAIARALVTSPDVLLADEPTGNLDSERSVEIMQLLTRLNAEKNITVLMVTHEPDMAAFARTVVHFKDGLVERIESQHRQGESVES